MPQHSEDVVAQRRTTVARLYLQGWKQSEIAAQEAVTQQQISQDLQAIRQEWQESALVDFNELKSQELAKIDHLEATAYKAWFDSMEPLKKRSTKTRTGSLPAEESTDGPDVPAHNVEHYELTEERLGDPRYLAIVDRCIEKRIKIFGLEAPMKIAQTDTEGKTLQRAQTVYIVDTTNGQRPPDPDDDYNAPG